MASPVTFSGLSSGLDTKAIIAALVAVEGRKVGLLQTQQSDTQLKISAYDDLLGKMNALSTALDKIADANPFLAYRATLSKDGDQFLAATASSGAQAGTYQLHVDALAQSAFVRSDGFANPNTDLAIAGTLSIVVGSKQTDVTIDASNSTLNGIRDAINATSIDAVASVVFDGTNYHLELRGKQTGAANDVTVIAEPTQTQPPNSTVLNLAQIRAASDAAFTIDGQSYTSASNTVTNALPGVTLDLLGQQDPSASAIQLTISADSDRVRSNVQSVITAYNDVITFLNTQGKARASSGETPQPLAGESALLSTRSSFSRILSSEVDVGSNYTSLASIGLTTQNDGTLVLDSDKLTAALAADPNGVKELFTTNGTGIASQLRAAIDRRTDSVNGVITLRKSAFKTSIDALTRRISQAQSALDKYEQGLVRKYATLETLMSRLKTQGAALGQFSQGTGF